MNPKDTNYGRVFFRDGRMFSTPPPTTYVYTPTSGDYQIVKSPFNSNRYCAYRKYTTDGSCGNLCHFTNNNYSSNQFTFHMNFRYSRNAIWVEPININITPKYGNYYNFTLRIREGTNSSTFYFFYSDHFINTGVPNFGCNTNGTIDFTFDGSNFKLWYNGKYVYTLTSLPIKRITGLTCMMCNTRQKGIYDHLADFYYDDVFCYFGKQLITSNYTPDYSKYFMWEEFYPHVIYDQHGDKYSL